MLHRAPLTYGGVPVPYTASWSGEEATFVSPCPFAGGASAIWQHQARGVGKPRFGKPHFTRQREVIARDLCDLCAGSLRNRTKISLSHARPRSNGATGFDVLQVEPLLHFECAQTSARYCPSLKRDLASGAFEARIVSAYRVQLAICDSRFIGEYVPGYVAAPSERIVGHAKVELLKSRPLSGAKLRAFLKDA